MCSAFSESFRPLRFALSRGLYPRVLQGAVLIISGVYDIFRTACKKRSDIVPDLFHHALEFLTDSLKLLVVGGVPAQELELLLDADLEVQEEEGKKPAHTLARIADSLPGMGIVAAVLGIVITMQAIGGPASEVGHKVAAALVGTFLGVLLCYGFVQPLSAQIEYQAESEELFLKSIKAGIVAYAKGMPPIVAVEFARRVIVSDYRPGYAEVEEACRTIKVRAN